ncbi:MAG: hypothetical protein WAM14_20540 [Candidatus Nitrosopolaris sp.]
MYSGVIYVDTEWIFRPERVEQIATSNNGKKAINNVEA